MPEEKRLTLEECHVKAAECREMAVRAEKTSHRVMLNHMAETWERICADMKSVAN